MLRFCLVFLFLLFSMSAFADETEDQLKSFLQSRVVIEQIYFETATSKLSQKTCNVLDRLIPELREKAADNVLFRVEGFTSPEGSALDNFNLSMSRALTVRTYLREKHDLDFEMFLTGFGPVDLSKGNEESRRVDIAMYYQSAAVMAFFDDHDNVEKIILK